MSRPQKKPLGICSKREIRVHSMHVCDWYNPSRKGKYKVCCRNCSYFTHPKDIPDPKTSPDNSKVQDE